MTSRREGRGRRADTQTTLNGNSTHPLVENARSNHYRTCRDRKRQKSRDNQNKDCFNEDAIKSNNDWLNEPKKQAKVKTTEPHTLSTPLKEAFSRQGEKKMNPFRESWGTLLKESMCKDDDCKGCRGCKSCPKCKSKGSTCEKSGCA